MSKARPILSALLGILFAGAIVVYSFIEPFQPGAVSEAIPAAASFARTADHLDELLSSPVGAQLDKALGAELRAIAAESDWTRWIAPAEVALADIPFHSAGQDKAWAAVSWVGWRAPWIRWKLEAAEGAHLRFMERHAAWPIWRVETERLGRGKHLAIALTDNLFIACLSEHPSDIKLVLDTYDKRAPARPKGH